MQKLTNNNIILMTDSYKFSHWSQMPDGLEMTQFYIESRGGEYDQVMVAGINYISHVLSQGISMEDVVEANELTLLHFGRPIFNLQGWTDIVTELGGKLPIKIRSIEEGTVIPAKNPLVIVESTHPKFAWVVGHLETMLLRAIWYPTTVATVSFEAKKIIKRFIDMTVDEDTKGSVLPFRLHDFGPRGCSSGESSAIGGLAHLYNFMGTDNVEALVLARNLYGEKMAGFSIPAREHSTTTIYGKEGEDSAFLNSIEQWGDGLYACVMDSYDYEAALERITTGELKDRIIKAGGTFVIRPDSGNPVDVVMQALHTVEKNVGVTYNSKGYKVLHPSYRVIQGDGVNVEEIGRILSWMESNKFSAENVSFGMGGGLLQQLDRDTQRFAMKCCGAVIGMKVVEVFKSPKTDPSKASKKGFLDVIREDGIFKTVSTTDLEKRMHNQSVMKTYFEDGGIIHKDTLQDIRGRSW